MAEGIKSGLGEMATISMSSRDRICSLKIQGCRMIVRYLSDAGMEQWLLKEPWSGHFLTHRSVRSTHFSPSRTSRPSCCKNGTMISMVFSHFPLGADSERTKQWRQEGRGERDKETHIIRRWTDQETVITVLVQEEHARFKRHGNLLGC